MTRRPSTKAKRVLAALRRNGWEIKRTSESHRTLVKEGYQAAFPRFGQEFRTRPSVNTR